MSSRRSRCSVLIDVLSLRRFHAFRSPPSFCRPLSAFVSFSYHFILLHRMFISAHECGLTTKAYVPESHVLKSHEPLLCRISDWQRTHVPCNSSWLLKRRRAEVGFVCRKSSADRPSINWTLNRCTNRINVCHEHRFRRHSQRFNWHKFHEKLHRVKCSDARSPPNRNATDKRKHYRLPLNMTRR